MSASFCFASTARPRARRLAAWLAQGFVALSFGAGAIMKLGLPIARLAALWPWTGDLPVLAVRALGVVDLAGALGVSVPALLGWPRGLTRLAAIGCVALQTCAMVFHASRGEFAALPVNVALLAASAVIVRAYRQR